VPELHAEPSLIQSSGKFAINFIASIIDEYCPDLEIAGTANSAAEGTKVINLKHL
jgi:hypothetical protein